MTVASYPLGPPGQSAPLFTGSPEKIVLPVALVAVSPVRGRLRGRLGLRQFLTKHRENDESQLSKELALANSF